jgi:hypothetical protein
MIVFGDFDSIRGGRPRIDRGSAEDWPRLDCFGTFNPYTARPLAHTSSLTKRRELRHSRRLITLADTAQGGASLASCRDNRNANLSLADRQYRC